MTRSDRAGTHHTTGASGTSVSSATDFAQADAQRAPARAALSLVPPRTSRVRTPRSPLVLWHLLSLDAPSVAALWTFTIAYAARVHLSWTEPAAMFVAVWMLYAADRLLDARPLPNGDPPPELEERHRFHQRHRRAFLSGIVFAACCLALLLHLLQPAALHLYALLAALLAAWLLLIHTRPLPAADGPRLPKELAVGIFFPAAVFIPTVARQPQLRLALLAPALLFAAVCTLNCLCVYAWEHPEPRLHAHWTTRWGARRLTMLALLIGAASAAFLSISVLHSSSAPAHASSLLASCTLLSACLLLALHQDRRSIRPIVLRALADLVLLTPLLVLPLARLIRR